MDTFLRALKLRYLVSNPGQVLMRFGEHLQMTVTALLIALAIAVPLGVLVTRYKRLEGPLLSSLGVLYTVPSLALLVLLLMIPSIGLGSDNATIVLVLYAQVILVRNVVVGLNGVDRDIVEAAEGMGMSAWQRLIRIEMPLALPVIIAGIRIAAVTIIGIATVAALVNAGGLGRLLFDGISRSNDEMIVAGAIGAGTLAALVNSLLRLLERRATLAIQGDEA